MFKRSAVFLWFVFLVFSARSQSIDSALYKLSNDFTQEKCYLHFDKNNYVPGETIWFKVYVMEANYPAFQSKTLYADWTNEKGDLVYRHMLPITNGTAFGQYDIPANYMGNSLHVKVYTKWMLNFDSSFLYNKDIRIIQPASLSATKKPAPQYQLQFFPEGGGLVAGVTNRVAFLTNDQWGNPVTIKGVIKNSKGKVVDSLRVVHDGMGSFSIFPEADEKFTAEWTDEKKIKHNSPLPLPGSGVSLQVAVSGTKRHFMISAGPGGPSLVHLVGTMNQFEVFRVNKDLSAGPGKGVIPTDQLPSGILTITAFDDTWKPLAERITFVNNHEYRFEPQMEVEHWGLSKRARDEVRITIPDSIMADLSVSVTDADIDTDSSNTIISHLLLTSDLKGYIHDPAFYFRSDADSLAAMLDLVMLTHGWRRIGWQALAKNTFPEILYPRDTSYATISGQVLGALPAQLRDAGDIYVILEQKDAKPQMLMIPIQKDGGFNDPAHILFDTARVYYQFAKKKEMGEAQASFLQNRLPVLSSNTPAAVFTGFAGTDTSGMAWHNMLADEERLKKRFDDVKQLGNVTVTAKKKTPLEAMDEKYTSGLFSSGDAYQFDLVNDPTSGARLNIFSYLQGRVAGLQIVEQGAQTSLSWRGGTPQLYVDEIPTQVDAVASVPVTDVAYIKVFRPPFIGAFGGGAGGAIAIYTRKGGDQKREPGKGLNSTKIMGYTISRQFYSPNYDSFAPENENRDIRTTIYWNPQLLLDPRQKSVVLKFYNNDVTRAFRVIIEGMTSDGRLAHVEQMME